MDAESKARLAALVEERLKARFGGLTLDGPTIREVAEYLDDLRARIIVDEATGAIVERDALDPALALVHLMPQLYRISVPTAEPHGVDMTISRDPSDPSRLVVSTTADQADAIAEILAKI